MTKLVKNSISIATILLLVLVVIYVWINRNNPWSSEVSDWIAFFSFITIVPTFVIVLATLWATSGTKEEVEKSNREIKQQIILTISDCFAACIHSEKEVDRIAVSRLEAEIMALEHSPLFKVPEELLMPIKKTAALLNNSYRDSYEDTRQVLLQIHSCKEKLKKQEQDLVVLLYQQM